MKNTKQKKYEAMGFVESLIAIMIVGVSSVVLMQIAANTTQSMIQNETIDIMTQYAVEGSTMAQDIAMQQRLGNDKTLFPPLDGCYLISKDTDTNQYIFNKENGIFVQYTKDTDRNEYKESGKLAESDGRFFRVFCIEGYNSGDKYAIVRVIVGQVNYDGLITEGSNVKDYSYFTAAQLL